MTLFALSLVAALAAGDSVPTSAPFSSPSTARAQAAAVVVHQQPALPLVVLRLALLADDPPGYAGTGHLLQHLIYPRLQEQVGRVGGSVQMKRTSDAVVYTVSGPAVELDFLAEALRSTLHAPQASGGSLLRASRELTEERLAEWETAHQHVRARLRAQMFPNDISAAGNPTGAARLLEENAYREAWAQMYRPERISVVAVGDVTLDQVQSAFAQLPTAPEPPETELSRDTVDLLPLAPPQSTRAWLGLGYLANDMDPAVLSVAAKLVGDELRARLPDAEVAAEHWWTHHGQALAIVLSLPGAKLSDGHRALGTAVSSAEARLSPSRVYETAKALRREMLFYARTPERMAEVLGTFTDRTGSADAAQRFYAELERVDEEAVRAVLRDLLGQTPVRVELAPQKLNRS